MTGPSVPEPAANPELLGHEAALAQLHRALASGRLPHGWLLTGPRGIGKTTLAFRFARAVLAGPDAVDDTLALAENHPVFRQVARGAHPDLTVVAPARDPKTGKVKPEIMVGAIRAATVALRQTTALGGRRVLLVDDAERLNRNAANALLKCLEEPPSGAVLVLVSERPARLAATIRSRCAKLALGRLPDRIVIEALQRLAPDLAAGQRSALAALARGSLGRAYELAEGSWLALYQRLVTELARPSPDRGALHALALDLARSAETDGFGAALGPVQDLLARVVAAALGRSGPALFVEEPAALQHLAARRPLDRWSALWEKIGRLAAAVDGLSLDRAQALTHILTLLALTSRQEDELFAGTSSLGAPDVLG